MQIVTSINVHNQRSSSYPVGLSNPVYNDSYEEIEINNQVHSKFNQDEAVWKTVIVKIVLIIQIS